MEEQKIKLAKTLESEIQDYLTKTTNVSPEYDFSQHKLIRRISLFENKIYPTGKFVKGTSIYKYWYDIITPRIDSEVKNVDFDSKNIEAYSPNEVDEVPNLVTNLKLIEYLRENGIAEELNSSIEEGSSWGNIVWKRVKGTFERVDLKNFYVINQTAENLSKSPVIERHQRTQAEIRDESGNWKYVDEVLKGCGQNLFKSDVSATEQDTTMPIYTMYERNGEVNLKDLKEYLGEIVLKGDENKFTFAKVIGAGTEGTEGGVKIKYIVYAKDLGGMTNADIYEEYHRGRYKGRWFREGLIELLFDHQTRANQIGNQLAQGLEYAALVLFTGKDKQIIQNVISDLKNGDYLRGEDLRQVEVRMQGFDQLLADWNRNLEQADAIANSREVVQGITPASGTPLGTSQLLNTNANKLFDFIREKLTIPLTKIFEKEVIPKLIKNITAQEVLRLTGDSKMMDRMRELIVNDWYVKNLVVMGPHTKEMADAIKEEKMKELSQKKDIFMKGIKSVFENYRARVSIVITGENTRRYEEIDMFTKFTPLITDPVRRDAMVDLAMQRAGIDVGNLPKSPPPEPVQPKQTKELTNTK